MIKSAAATAMPEFVMQSTFLTDLDCEGFINFAQRAKYQASEVYVGSNLSSGLPPSPMTRSEFRKGETARLDRATLGPDPATLRLEQAVREANKLFFFERFQELACEIRVNRYAPGDFFEWHQDNEFGPTRARKLTALVLLEMSTDLLGGELQFKNENVKTLVWGKGDLVIFPSHRLHRVLPVIQGSRTTMNIWFHAHTNAGIR